MKKTLIFSGLIIISSLAISEPNYTYTIHNNLKNNAVVLSGLRGKIFSTKGIQAYSINYKASGQINLKCPEDNDFNFFSYKPSKDKSGEFVLQVDCSVDDAKQKLKVIPLVAGNDLAMTIDNSIRSIYFCSSKTYSLNGSSCAPEK